MEQGMADAGAALHKELDLLRDTSHADLAARHRAARDAWRRAASREGSQAEAGSTARPPPATLIALLASAAALAERDSAACCDRPVLAAAWALHGRVALALPRAADRHLALALAAVAVAAAGRPCHLLAASEEDAGRAAQAMRPVFDACATTSARVAADTTPGELIPAYRADVVHTTARRLAGDLARDRRLAKGNAASGTTLTRGLHTALLDDLDRVLVEDASAPIVMSIADDATDLATAIAAARQLCDQWAPGSALEDHDGLKRLAASAARLPPFWRRADRRESLLRQALFVRDRLRPGQDYDLSGNGQLMLDDSLHERVPERDLLSGITQALQARLGLPLSPLARTVDRVSVPAFFTGFRHLAGLAPCLEGLAKELWRSQRLLVCGEASLPRSRLLAFAQAQDSVTWLQRQAQEARATAAPHQPLLVVLRRMSDLAPVRPLMQPGRVGLALESHGLNAALRAQGLAASDGATAARSAKLHIVFAEPLASRRAEQAFAARVADACGRPVQASTLLTPATPLLKEHAGPLAAAAQALGLGMPALSQALLRAALALARWRAQRMFSQRRLAIQQRERQLQQQLSFAEAAPRPTLPRPSHRPTVIG